MLKLSRNKAQTKALEIVYALLTYKSIDVAIDVEHLLSGIVEAPLSEVPIFLKAVALYTVKHAHDVEVLLTPHLTDWTWERLNRLTQSILTLAVVHKLYVDTNVPKAVVINIAIKQAKLYLDDGDHKFINAILDEVLPS